MIVLDPVNRGVIDTAIADGGKDFVGGNCTVSLMLMALGGLFEVGAVEWVSSMTYQSASGAGARHMTELVEQMKHLGKCADDAKKNKWSALELEHAVHASMRGAVAEDGTSFPTEQFGAPLACSLLPFIDKPMPDGRSKEEWKGMFETNKILSGVGVENEIPVDGACVRVGALRCHSQGITLKLKSAMPLEEIEELIKNHNEWVEFVPNDKEETMKRLTPVRSWATFGSSFGVSVRSVLDSVVGHEMGAVSRGGWS